MSDEEQPQEVQALSAKQIKQIAKPKFAANPEKYYPVETMKKFGYTRAQCPKCKEHFWRHSETRTVCGDSACEGKYHFIGTGVGVGVELRAKNQRYSLGDAWRGFSRSLCSSRIPCTAIPRYPVVARWRRDVDYVAAGIYCFQPHCVTGELEPPANPLICPQFCLRFNDLDNIGISGRHFSGFIMLGIQVFNTPQNYVFFKDECVEFNLRWLTEELKIPLDDITLVEDVWCGGGNLGPSIEYFVKGLELGNMVFMQYKITNPKTGEFEPLQVQVIDVGIGLERIPWIINGTPTSYIDAFPNALQFLKDVLKIPFTNDVLTKFGPYSCLLNMDEVDDINKAYETVCAEIGLKNKEELFLHIQDVRDMYIIADHTRSILIALEDGALPSAVGGASNLRNIIRRVFSLLFKNKWWGLFGKDEEERMKTFLLLFEAHRKDLAEVYGETNNTEKYTSFGEIISVEFERWKTTDEKSAKLLEQYQKKKKGAAFKVEDWINCHKSFGISPDKLSELMKCDLPDNFFSQLADMEAKKMRSIPQMIYETAVLSPTHELFDEFPNMEEFDAEVVDIKNIVKEDGTKTNERKVIILNRSCFYPTSGGQDHDNGILLINGTEYKVVDVDRVGKCTLHIVDVDLPETIKEGTKVHGKIDIERRTILRNHHSATHVVYQSARSVLGPHVWQHGAKKTVEEAHLDITHYNSLTFAQEREIETQANLAVRKNFPITKTWWPKEKAEQTYGYKLYQGGIAPGKQLRVVDIQGFDTEACCGTHCDTTGQIGLIRLVRSHRVSDGIVRLHFVAGDRALEFMNEENTLLNSLCSLWGISKQDILPTATRFFQGYKKFSTIVAKQAAELVNLQIRAIVSDEKAPERILLISDESDPTLYISNVKPFAPQLAEKKKSILVIGKEFLWGIGSVFDVDKLTAALEVAQTESKTSKRKAVAATPTTTSTTVPAKEKKPLRVMKGFKVKASDPNEKKPKMVQVDLVEIQGSFLNNNPFLELATNEKFVEYKF